MLDQLLKITNDNQPSQWYPIIYHKHKDIYQWIDNKTNYLDNSTISEKIYHITNNLTKSPVCKTCDKKVRFISYQKGYSTYCSSKCAKNDNDNKEKYKQTCLEKYGVENPFQALEVKNKIKNVVKEKYGVDNISQSDSNKIKVRNTMIEKFGKWFTKTEEYRNKTKQTCLEKYGVENHIQTDFYKNLRSSDIIENYQSLLSDNLIFIGERNTPNQCEIKCSKCNKSQLLYWETFYKYLDTDGCLLCNYNDIGSKAEIEINQFLESLGISNIIRHDRKVLDSKKELDFYLPDYNLAIEFNGLYWHSYQINNDKNYHSNKTDECLSKGIQLIQIFEDEWENKRDIVKSKITYLLNKCNNRLHARKCQIKEIPSSLKNQFLIENHLQGKDICKYSYGAFYNDELIAVMTFSNFSKAKGRTVTVNQYELSRFCIRKYISCSGLFSKMFKFFINQIKPEKLVTYADRRWSVGDVYEKLFEKILVTKPNYWYIKPNELKRYHRYTYRKSELKNMTNYNEELTEQQIMTKEGFGIIYDCGNIRYEYTT